jgi:hypothetical protein
VGIELRQVGRRSIARVRSMAADAPTRRRVRTMPSREYARDVQRCAYLQCIELSYMISIAYDSCVPGMVTSVTVMCTLDDAVQCSAVQCSAVQCSAVAQSPLDGT